jgi:hypothetical protein
MRLALFASAVLAIVLSPSASSAQSSSILTYDVVTEYSVAIGSPNIAVVGVVSGASAPSSMNLLFQSSASAALIESCERDVVQMINRPGRFQFAVDTGSAIPINATYVYVQKCTLRQKP